AFALAGELEVLVHPRSEYRGHLEVLWQRRRNNTSARTVCHGRAAGQRTRGLVRESPARGRIVPLRRSGVPFCRVSGLLERTCAHPGISKHETNLRARPNRCGWVWSGRRGGIGSDERAVEFRSGTEKGKKKAIRSSIV